MAAILFDRVFGPILMWRADHRARRTAELVQRGSEPVYEIFRRSREAGYQIPMNPEDVDELVYEVLKAVGKVR